MKLWGPPQTEPPSNLPNWGPLSQIKGFKQGPLISNKGSQTGATFLKLGFQTPGLPFLRLKFYIKLNKLFSNAKYKNIILIFQKKVILENLLAGPLKLGDPSLRAPKLEEP